MQSAKTVKATRPEERRSKAKAINLFLMKKQQAMYYCFIVQVQPVVGLMVKVAGL